MKITNTDEELEKLIDEEIKIGNICFEGIGGIILKSPIDKFIQQSLQGILYDLNLLPEATLSRYGTDWVNKYATYLVIKKLKEMIDNKVKED